MTECLLTRPKWKAHFRKMNEWFPDWTNLDYTSWKFFLASISVYLVRWTVGRIERSLGLMNLYWSRWKIYTGRAEILRPLSSPLRLGQLQPYIHYITCGHIIVSLATWDNPAPDMASLTSEQVDSGQVNTSHQSITEHFQARHSRLTSLNGFHCLKRPYLISEVHSTNNH